MNEAEASCIACAFLNPAAAARVVASLRVEHYTDPRLAAMHWAIAHLVARGEDVSRLAVRRVAAAKGSALTADDVGAVGGLFPIVEDVGGYIHAVREAHARRSVAAEVARMGRDLADPSQEHRLIEIMERGSAVLTREAAALAPEARPEHVRDTVARLLRERDNPTEGLPWGLETLREGPTALPPMSRGQFIVIAADTGHGKSTFMAQNAVWQARQGRRVLWIGLEMSRDETLDMACRLEIGVSPLSRRYWPTHDPGGASEAWAETWEDVPFDCRDDLHTLPEIERAVRVASMSAIPPAVVYVDYIQRVSVPGAANEFQAASLTSKSLKRLAAQTGIPVVTASQFNKDLTKLPPGKEPTIGMLKDSSSIGQDANVILILWRPDPESVAKLDHVLSCRHAKHRGAPAGHVYAWTWLANVGCIADAPLAAVREHWNRHQRGPHDWPDRIAALRIPGAGG